MLVVNVHFQAAPGKEAALKAGLLGLVEPTRKEDGCILYDLHQSPDDPGKFMFYEIWTSRETLDRHSASAHILAFRGVRDTLLAKPGDLTLWEKLD